MYNKYKTSTGALAPTPGPRIKPISPSNIEEVPVLYTTINSAKREVTLKFLLNGQNVADIILSDFKGTTRPLKIGITLKEATAILEELQINYRLLNKDGS